MSSKKKSQTSNIKVLNELYKKNINDNSQDEDLSGNEDDNIVLRNNKKNIRKKLDAINKINENLNKYEGKIVTLKDTNEGMIIEEYEEDEDIEKNNDSDDDNDINDESIENNDEDDESNNEVKKISNNVENKNDSDSDMDIKYPEDESEDDGKESNINKKNITEKSNNNTNNNVNNNTNKDKNIKNNSNSIDNNNDDDTEIKNKENESSLNLKSQLEKEDEEYLRKISSTTKSEAIRGKNILNQKRLYESFVGLRISMQNMLNDINSLPCYEEIKKFLGKSEENINDVYKNILDNLKETLIEYLEFYKDLLIKQNYPKGDNFNPPSEIEKIIKKINNLSEEKDLNKFDELFNVFRNKISQIDKKILNIWYRKTLVNQFKSSNKILKVLNNDNFCEHILNSVNTNKDTLIKKTKKIQDIELLGRKREKEEDFEYDNDIYNDSDFYHFLIKEILLINEKELDTSNQKEYDENGMKEGRYDLTMKYLLNKVNKQKKKVDTKASKNRKIRYDKHEEIINFTVPIENSLEINGRDLIINSIFGKRKVINKNNENNENNIIDVDII